MTKKEEEIVIELWIRSQNRGSIIKAKEISLERSNKKEGWVVIKANITDGSNGWLIGEYETEERGLEVLEEIEDYLWGEGSVYEMPEE